ncbi:TetR/AcrR family transcriptional regulator [Phycicoccus sp. Soil748]|uniref:TetR/AcrR family transcriptional regulator n=1 Tax=Intrasporangiaceae TaxID=85021 RepID=UPI000702B169|nr:TetR/AcrR family transcriptional regulator [Phycicoccus sp. Soil748]KRE58695.1 TetR family transcriptional regulator [Phycicoccus sp. Soil748]
MSDAEVGAPRRGRPGHDQEAVLRKAVDLFIEQGYDGTSMGDLARALGFSKSAIYHHVPSKTHLLSQALDEALDGLTEVLDEASREKAGTTAYERLRRAVRRSVEVLVDHQPAVTLLLRVRGNSEVEVAALRRRRDLDARFAALVREAVDEGSLRSDVSPVLVSRLLFGMVNSLVEWHRPGGTVDAAQLSDAITTIAFDGLALVPADRGSAHQS